MNTESVQQSKMEKEQRTRLEQCKRLNTCARKGQIVFVGSSLMEFFPVNELQQSLGINVCVYNRGVSGYISEQLLAHMQDLILDLEPSKLFINIGTNDIGRGIADQLWSNYETILRRVQAALPDCRIYVMAYYPCNDLDDFGMSEAEHQACFRTRMPESLIRANQELEHMAQRLGCRYIDVNHGLYDGRGRLRREICMDGVHLYADGYISVLENLKAYLLEE